MRLTLNDRKVIAKRWADGESAVAIAKNLGRSPGTIYAELMESGSVDAVFNGATRREQICLSL